MSKSPKTPPRRRTARSGARDDPAPFEPVSVRLRHDGWTHEKQFRFIEALAQSACVEEACRAVGMSRQSVYRLRVQPDAQAFRMAWDASIDLGIRRLTDVCLSRAISGEEVPHFYQGELVGTHRRFDNRLAMFLLRYRDPLRYARTLDEMVYSGHPEGASSRFTKAANRVWDEARGYGPMEPDEEADAPMAWTTVTAHQARTQATEDALIESGRPIQGSFARKDHFQRKRQAKLRTEIIARSKTPDYQAHLAEAQQRWDALPNGNSMKERLRPCSGQEEAEWAQLFGRGYAMLIEEAEAKRAAAEAALRADEAPASEAPQARTTGPSAHGQSDAPEYPPRRDVVSPLSLSERIERDRSAGGWRGGWG